MAITYKLHTWSDGNSYINLEDGNTSRIRIKKLDDGDEIKNLDHDLPVDEMETLSDAQMKTIIDRLTDTDEAEDTAELARRSQGKRPIIAGLNTRLKAMTVKDRIGPPVPKETP